MSRVSSTVFEFVRFFARRICAGSAGTARLRPLSGVDKKNRAIAAAAEMYRPHDRTKKIISAALGLVGSSRPWLEPHGKRKSNITDRLRRVPLGVFQRSCCRPMRWLMSHFRAGQGIDMLVNRRRSERQECRRAAKIQFGTSSLPRDCTITDVSRGGLKVVAEYPEIPSVFTITLSTGELRQCRLAWRIGCEFGAEFID
jgi:hypothetical protein